MIFLRKAEINKNIGRFKGKNVASKIQSKMLHNRFKTGVIRQYVCCALQNRQALFL